MTNCSVCGRPLKNPESIAAGVGPVCQVHDSKGKVSVVKQRKPRALKTQKKLRNGGAIAFRKKAEKGYRFKHVSQQNRADYKAIDDGEFIVIFDLNKGNLSLTNYLAEALYEIYYHQQLEIYERKVIYRDSMMKYDAVIIEKARPDKLTQMFYPKFSIQPLQVDDVKQAKELYDVRYKRGK